MHKNPSKDRFLGNKRSHKRADIVNLVQQGVQMALLEKDLTSITTQATDPMAQESMIR